MNMEYCSTNKNEITFLRGARNESNIHKRGKTNVTYNSVIKYSFPLYIMKKVCGNQTNCKECLRVNVLVSLVK